MSSNGSVALPALPRKRGRPRSQTLTPLAASADPTCAAAYTAIYEASKWTGGSVAAALAMVREWWDDDEDGALPDVRTAQRWAERDGWAMRVMQEIADDRRLFDATINLAMKRNLLLALNVQGQILRGEGDPRFAVAQRGVARDLMFLCGAGILGVRYGDVDTEAARDGSRDDHGDDDLTVEQIAERAGQDYLRYKRALGA